jgi:hypothetical protein
MSGDDSKSGGFKPSTEPRRKLDRESAKERRRRLEFAETVEAPAINPGQSSNPKEKPVDPFAKTLTAIPAKEEKRPAKRQGDAEEGDPPDGAGKAPDDKTDEP